VVIDPDVTPAPATQSDTCSSPTPVGNNTYQCTITVNSPTTGEFKATATGNATVAKTGVPGSAVVSRSTGVTILEHGVGGNDGATKTYVDARMSVTPDGLNEVNHPHTVNGKVEIKDGNGAWTLAPDGTTIDFATVSGPGGFVNNDDDCTTAGGTCSVQINSATIARPSCPLRPPSRCTGHVQALDRVECGTERTGRDR
jgi:hypothetical protein